MLTIRRKVTAGKGYTVFMLPGYYREWQTSDYEHAQILKLYKQDRPHEGIHNDFTEYRINGAEAVSSPLRGPVRPVDRV